MYLEEISLHLAFGEFSEHFKLNAPDLGVGELLRGNAAAIVVLMALLMRDARGGSNNLVLGSDAGDIDFDDFVDVVGGCMVVVVGGVEDVSGVVGSDVVVVVVVAAVVVVGLRVVVVVVVVGFLVVVVVVDAA